MKVFNPDRTEIVEKALKSMDSSELLATMRKMSGIFPWKFIDFFLYSGDLNAFFFPPGTSGEPDDRYRNAFKEIAGSGINPQKILSDTENSENYVSEKTGGVTKLYPMKTGDRTLGFIFAAFPDKPKITDDEMNELKFIASLCEASITLHFKNLENEKLSLENSILRKNLSTAENLKLLGEMIGGITHDFNNILAGVNGFAQLLQLAVKDEDFLDSINEILDASDSGKKIVNFISRIKKTRTDENIAIMNLVNIVKNAAAGVIPLIRQLRPGVETDEFIKINSGELPEIEIRPTVAEQLFLQIFTALLKAGASQIEVDIKSREDKIQATISHTIKSARATPPIKTETDEKFPASLILYLLSELLDFNFYLSESKITLEFYVSEESHYKPGPGVLNGKSFLVYEPDSTLRSLFEKALGHYAAGCRVTGSVETFSEAVAGKKKYNAIIMDVSILQIVDVALLCEKSNRLILTSSWGRYLNLEDVGEGPEKQILLKPFTLQGLMRSLKYI